MAYKSILVHLNGQARDAQTLAVACNIARRFDAHLTAIFASDQAVSPMAGALDPAAVAAQRLAMDYDRQLQGKANLLVQAAENREGFKISWHAMTDNVLNNFVQRARCADLIVMTQEDPSSRFMLAPSQVAKVLLNAGHPLLIVPFAGDFATCGESVLIGWSATRESARAVSDALPLMQNARVVHLVSFNNAKNADADTGSDLDVGQWLARHGLNVNCRQQTSKDVDVGNQMLSLAAELESDLIVMGGYGHARSIEFFLGGVTKTLLDTMTVPVLMSH